MKVKGKRKTTKKLIDLTGQTFKRLTVDYYDTDRRRWFCHCTCGNSVYVESANLRRGCTKSCGCLNTETRKKQGKKMLTTHGLSHLPEYKIWANIRQRCDNPNSPAYRYYGGRGISYDPAWNDFTKFLEDVGRRPAKDLELDRIDNDGDYRKENCRWVPRKVQINNRSNTKLFTFKGESLVLSEWARKLGINKSTLSMRYYVYGWSVEKTLGTPARHKNHT